MKTRRVSFLSSSRDGAVRVFEHLAKSGGETDLVYPQRIVPALQQLPKRRLTPPPHVLIDRLQNLDRTRERTRLDDADECPADARPRLEERRVRRYPLRTLQAGGGIHRVERVQWEGDHLALC